MRIRARNSVEIAGHFARDTSASTLFDLSREVIFLVRGEDVIKNKVTDLIERTQRDFKLMKFISRFSIAGV